MSRAINMIMVCVGSMPTGDFESPPTQYTEPAPRNFRRCFAHQQQRRKGEEKKRKSYSTGGIHFRTTKTWRSLPAQNQLRMTCSRQSTRTRRQVMGEHDEMARDAGCLQQVVVAPAQTAWRAEAGASDGSGAYVRPSGVSMSMARGSVWVCA